MSDEVGVRELRQNLSVYLREVKAGATLRVTERGTEIARLVPSGPTESALGRLIAERGATVPAGSLAELALPEPAVGGPSSAELLDELRAER